MLSLILAAVVGGSWAGDGIVLEATARGARVEYDCAHGTIDSVITPDKRGRFTAAGTHVEERGGPVRPGDDAGYAVRYTGDVRGDRMTLTVTRVSDGEGLGTFTLVKGGEPSLVKCR